jgi:DNA mismatch endonuclease (patch repair protein)
VLHREGYRFRLHPRDLPGKPDIVLPRFRTVVFVHGCFWHRHPGCRYAYNPKSREAFWQEKFRRNVQRDEEAGDALRSLGWRVLYVWECETKDEDALRKRLCRELDR